MGGRCNFGSHDAMKGPRNKFKILIVSDMHQTLQHDAKTNWSKFKIAFFQHGPTGDNETCQKKNFWSKNLCRSKQTAEKLNK